MSSRAIDTAEPRAWFRAILGILALIQLANGLLA